MMHGTWWVLVVMDDVMNHRLLSRFVFRAFYRDEFVETWWLCVVQRLYRRVRLAALAVMIQDDLPSFRS